MKLNSFNTMDNTALTHHLMVWACLASSAVEHEDFVREWEDTIVMDEMDYSSMRMVPLFLDKNQLFGITTKHDNRLKIIYKHWWLKTKHIFYQLEKVYAAFKNAGIEAIVIKGASVISYYERPELRPMTDFDLLVRPEELKTALVTLKELGYSPDKVMEATFYSSPALLTDFRHSMECIHTVTGTKIDLHWRIGSLCTAGFTDDLRLHLDDYEVIPGAKKPQLAYDAFITIMHGVLYGSWDNLNWIIDIALLNLKTGSSFWEKARQLAVDEKKEDLFDKGCSILLEYGVYAPEPKKATDPQIIIELSDHDRMHMPRLKLYAIKSKNFFLFLKCLFPYSGYSAKIYQGMRLIKLFLIYRRYKWLNTPST